MSHICLQYWLSVKAFHFPFTTSSLLHFGPTSTQDRICKSISLTLGPNLICSDTVNSHPVHLESDEVNYGMPQPSVRFLSLLWNRAAQDHPHTLEPSLSSCIIDSWCVFQWISHGNVGSWKADISDSDHSSMLHAAAAADRSIGGGGPFMRNLWLCSKSLKSPVCHFVVNFLTPYMVDSLFPTMHLEKYCTNISRAEPPSPNFSKQVYFYI